MRCREKESFLHSLHEDFTPKIKASPHSLPSGTSFLLTPRSSCCFFICLHLAPFFHSREDLSTERVNMLLGPFQWSDWFNGWSVAFSVFSSSCRAPLHGLQGSRVPAVLRGGHLTAKGESSRVSRL